MDRKMKRMLATVLVLVLSAGYIITPIRAAATAGESETTPVDGGTKTVTVVVDGGTKTTTTDVSTSNPETGTTTQSTTTEVVTKTGNDSQTDTNWQETTTQTGSDSKPGNPSVDTDVTNVTTVTGSESTTVTVTTTPSGTVRTEKDTSGQEETVVDNTTVTTTTTTDKLLIEENSRKEETVSPAPKKTSSSSGWVATGQDGGSWVNGKVEQGKELTTVHKSESTTPIEAVEPGDVVIVMKPNGKTQKVRVDVTIDEVLAGVEIPENAVPIKKNGKVIGYHIVNVTETSVADPDPVVSETKETEGAVVQKPVTPGGYHEGVVTEGNVTTLTEAIRDESGSIIGYRITRTTVSEDTQVTTTESIRDTITETETAEDIFTLPEPPEESETTDEKGNVTKTVVEEIVEDGKTVGFKSITTVTDAKGEVLCTETKSIYGTTASRNTLIEKDPETEVETVKTTTTVTEVNEVYATVATKETTLHTERTNNITTTIVTEEEIYQLVETEDGLYFLYKGTMQPVIALPGHGDLTGLNPLVPTVRPTSKNDLDSTTAITNPPHIVNPGNPGSDTFKYIDYGLISDFRVTMADGRRTSEIHLYELVDKSGKSYYVYCADLDTTAYRNTIYDISNAKDEDYYKNNQDKEAYLHLQAIAINGYWGTSSGTGSLEAIRQLLRDNGQHKVADSITDGEALTATQAAIWTFGNNGSDLVNTKNPAGAESDKGARANIKALYDILISEKLKNETKNTETDLIKEEDITGATLNLKGKKKDSDGKEKYEADLTFTLAVEESALTGNLKLTVKDENGNDLCDEIQLLTEDSNFLGKLLADGSGYSYTIENLMLAEGVTINLNLEGYQNLKKGVYIYTAASGSFEDSQTFIGINEGKRDVNLQVALDFSVEDPQLEHVTKDLEQVREDTRVDVKEGFRIETKEDTEKTTTETTHTLTETNVKVFGTETVTETKNTVTRSMRTWQSHEESEYKIPHEDPKEYPKDEEDPEAKPPKTGDLTVLWMALSCLSMGGIGLLNGKREEEN